MKKKEFCYKYCSVLSLFELFVLVTAINGNTRLISEDLSIYFLDNIVLTQTNPRGMGHYFLVPFP